MNARLYDPTIARFMSADSIIPYMYDTQSFNRYSYVRNNPLKYTDPSGHFGFSLIAAAFKGVRNFVKKHWKTIATIAVVAALTFATGGFGGALLASSLGLEGMAASIVVGAVGGAGAGFVGGVVGTRLHGGSWDQSFSNGFKGALVGAVSGAVAGGIGAGFGHDASFFNAGGTKSMLNAGMKALAHGTSRAVIAKAQGQSATSGFWSGFAASGFSVGSSGYGGVAGRTAIMATVSGTVSEATGGKFANGAVSGAFVHLFNAEGTRLVAYAKGKFVGLKEEKYAYTSTADKVGKLIDSLNVSKSDFQAGLRNVGSVALATGGIFLGGVPAAVTWVGGAGLDAYSIYEHGGNLSYGAGSAIGNPYSGKAGAVVGTGVSIYNAYGR